MVLSRSKKRKGEEGKSSFLKGCYAGLSGLPPHLPRLGTGIELYWVGIGWEPLTNYLATFH